MNDIFKKSINDMEFSNRTTNALWRAGYRTVRDLAVSNKTEIMRSIGLGQKGFTEIAEVLRFYGVGFHMKLPAVPQPGHWQPIQTAPRDETAILITNGLDVAIAVYNDTNPPSWPKYECRSVVQAFREGPHVSYPTNVYMSEPSHWMPLPELP